MGASGTGTAVALAGQPPRTRNTGGQKIYANRERDARKQRLLQDLGWRVIVVWQCEIGHRKELQKVFDTFADLSRAAGG